LFCFGGYLLCYAIGITDDFYVIVCVVGSLLVGDVVGFVDRAQQQRTGQIIRLNDKTVTLQCGPSQWRVGYSLLHRVVDVDGLVHEVGELGRV